MINVFVTYSLKDKETRDAFYQEIVEKRVGEKCRAENGNIRYSYYFPADEDNKVFLFEQWESAEAIKAHGTQPHYLELGKMKEKFNVETEVIKQEVPEE